MKDKILELVTIFGLEVDYDQWDQKGWMRIVSRTFPKEFGTKNNCVIIYDDESIEDTTIMLRNSIIEMGKKIKAKEFKTLLDL